MVLLSLSRLVVDVHARSNLQLVYELPERIVVVSLELLRLRKGQTCEVRRVSDIGSVRPPARWH